MAVLLFLPLLAAAQLAVTVSPMNVIGQKAGIPLAMKNSLADKIESARAVAFLMDNHDKVIAQSTKWVGRGGRKTRHCSASCRISRLRNGSTGHCVP
jgi:hypothetical protein